ncbi:MAG: hypothetical protein H6709_21240 [Kofleriaceae bacterium]|nr:hypothetical protein [Myxococcales bacterium]MCB9561669.1 hypothetical protein [Kofleriaceae bacterium]MCB9574609.1 hypothetical protein [Kofleriaceae bacterium]
MILITGDDPILDGLCDALEQRGHAHTRAAALDASEAWTLRPEAIVVVESLPRVATATSPPERALAELVSAANAPGVRRAVIVTPRPDDDPALRAVRRSGIPYTILRPRPIAEQRGETSTRVLLDRALASAPAVAVTVDMVIEAVIAVLDGEACGQTRDIAPPPEMTWSELLARAGATPKAVPRWRARVGRWFGARTLDVSVPQPAAPA